MVKYCSINESVTGLSKSLVLAKLITKLIKLILIPIFWSVPERMIVYIVILLINELIIKI